MITELKISVAFIRVFLKSIYEVIPKLVNLCRRPKANIEIRNQNIIVKDSDGVESHLSYPCILVSFKKDLKIDVGSIKINNERFCGMLSADTNYLKQSGQFFVTNNRIMPFIKENWQNLTQKKCLFEIRSYEQEVFPLNINTSMSHAIFKPKVKARVFFPSKKLIFSFNADGKFYEYGIPLIGSCKVIINNLASK